MNATIAANAPEKTNDHRHPHRWMMLANRSGAITPPAPTPPSKKLLPNPRSRGGVHHATILFAFGQLAASPAPVHSRIRPKPHARLPSESHFRHGSTPINTVQAPHPMSATVRVARGPKRSPTQPHGIWNSA